MKHPYTPYRRFLAWLGFATLYLLLPLCLALGLYILSASPDRPEPFYQQTKP